MNIKEPKELAFTIWGTKRGKKLFLQSNIDDDENTIDDELNDIRGIVGFKKTGSQFYSIEYKNSSTNLTIFNTINDWLGRLGYYAISICISNETKASFAIMRTLQELSETYKKEYIDKSEIHNQIREDKTENKTDFKKCIDNVKGSFTTTENKVKPHGNETCVVKFKNDEELESIIQEYLRNELLPYNRVFILPAKSYDLSHKFKEIPLKPIEKKYVIKFKTVKAKNTNETLNGVSITVLKNGEFIIEGHRIRNDFHQISDVHKRDSLNIQCIKPGYKKFNETIKIEEFVKDINGNTIEYNIKLEEEISNYYSHEGSGISKDSGIGEINNQDGNNSAYQSALEITVIDEEGNPIENANISLK